MSAIPRLQQWTARRGLFCCLIVGGDAGTASGQVRTLTLTLIFTFAVLLTGTAIGQEAAAPQPYQDPDAYEIYSLLLPHEEAYGFAEDILMIQENAITPEITGACLRPADASRFTAAIADYIRVREKSWLLERRFQIDKTYITVGRQVISALPDHPPSVVSYVRMSPVGFNRDKTEAVVFIESSCGRLCGSSRLHFLEKVHGKWKQVAVAACAAAC